MYVSYYIYIHTFEYIAISSFYNDQTIPKMMNWVSKMQGVEAVKKTALSSDVHCHFVSKLFIEKGTLDMNCFKCDGKVLTIYAAKGEDKND